MKRCSVRVGLVLTLLLCPAFSALGQDRVSVSGSVTDINGVAISETVQVRAWSWVEDEELESGERYTGYTVRRGNSAFVDADGAYELHLLPGDYKLDARVGVTTGISPCPTNPDDDQRGPCVYPSYSITNSRFWLEERWHEASTGFENHWVQEDATVLTVEEESPIEELSFRLRTGGAVEGRVRGYTESSPSSPTWMAGAKVRVEQVSDPRRHHNSVTLDDPEGEQGERIGMFVSRGLGPTLLHKLLVFDPEGYSATYVHELTHTPTGGEMFDFGEITLDSMDLDPYPTNRSFETAIDIGRWHFDQDPPPVWSSGETHLARIAPRNKGIVNWFCWEVRPEDRFTVTATTMDTIPELPGRYHPWMDPYLKVVDADDPEEPIPGTTADRYSGPGPLDAMIDTLLIEENALYCAAVTAAGDYDFTGNDQYMAGPYVLTIERNPNPYSTPPELGGHFDSQCSGGVVTDSPLLIPVTHDVGSEPFDIQLQVLEYGEDPEDPLFEIDEPADIESGVTTVSVDIGLIPDNSRYIARVRTYDGIYHSPWSSCDFWSNIRNNPPSRLEILSPEAGTVFPLGTTEVTVVVQNAYDPDLVVPGTSIEIAWCSSLSSSFEDCPSAVSEWNRLPQSSIDPSDTTEFLVDELTNREAWYIKACAMDETGICGPADDTWVVVGDGDGSQEAPSGCCTTSSSGDPWLAAFAVLLLALTAPRSGRRG